VVYKFADDQGPYLAALITFYGFLSLFPLLLLLCSSVFMYGISARIASSSLAAPTASTSRRTWRSRITFSGSRPACRTRIG
jgi:uncharacterized BrkB/YihY/UPF0761 family membrane protein